MRPIPVSTLAFSSLPLQYMDVGGFASAADCIDDLIAEYAAQVTGPLVTHE